MAAEEALKIDAAEWETSATAAIDRPKKEQLLPEAIVSRAYKAIEERHILLTLDPGMQRDMFEHEEAAKNLGAEAEANGNPELYYAAAVVYYNCGFLYHGIYNVGHGTQREPRLRTAIHYFKLTVQFAERAVKVWKGRDAAGMKPPGPPVAEFLAPPAGGRRRTRRRMKNPCWKGYKAYGMKRTRKGKVPNCVPRKTRRRHK